MTKSNTVFKGLNNDEVAARIAEGKVNVTVRSNTKSVKQIFKDNFFTFFNILNAVFAVLLIFTGTLGDLFFMVIILSNLIIGIIQELAAKKTLDKLSLVVQSKTDVVRSGSVVNIAVDNIVQDDIIILRAGNQICVDGTILDGEIEVNESLLTGESDLIVKNNGEKVLSGSFVVAGNAYIHVDSVGQDSYANRIAAEARGRKARNSRLMRSINAILKTISVIIIPLGLLTFFKQWIITQLPFDDNVVSTVASLISMVPEGLVLLTSMALAASAVLLAQKRTLVQNLYSIENLARTDVLCLDKTGTITKGDLKVDEVITVDGSDIKMPVSRMLGALQDNNATFNALREYFGETKITDLKWKIPFSSARKYSGACFSDIGCVFVGAYDFLFKNDHDIPVNTADIEGKRFIAVGISKKVPETPEVPEDIVLSALVVISDDIRENAKKTIEYFARQGVDIKVISGDNISAVSNVAKSVGISCRAVDMSRVSDEDIKSVVEKYNIFCRVLPEQKQKMVNALKKLGHTVSMIGDGVNDVLALKSADCSIAMAQGSDAARNISDIVLMESDFSTMPDAVCEGRKVINNIQRVAALFVTKTLYSIFISVMTLLIPSSIYPFEPFQLTVMSFIVIGFPAFFISFEPDYSRVKGNFLANVLRKSFPGALCVFIVILFVNILSAVMHTEYQVISTVAFILVSVVGLFVMLKVCWPISKLRAIILGICIFFLVACLTVPVLREWLEFAELSWQVWAAIAVISAVVPFLLVWFERLSDKVITAVAKIAKKASGLYGNI